MIENFVVTLMLWLVFCVFLFCFICCHSSYLALRLSSSITLLLFQLLIRTNFVTVISFYLLSGNCFPELFSKAA